MESELGRVLVVVVVGVLAAALGGLLVASALRRDRRGGAGDAGDVSPDAYVDGLHHLRGEVRADLERLERTVHELGRRSAEQLGQVDRSLRTHAEITQHLAATAHGLREALANPKVRGQWGERMAEDVLRLAGFREHVNYRKQTSLAGDARGIPDFTFFLPKGHVLYMDVKFPIAAYLRWFEAGTQAERDAHCQQFLRDVRARIRELADRDYARSSAAPAADHVLLFLPNETISAFLFEHDPEVIDHALRSRVVLCSPVSLFTHLALIRQAFDTFMVEETSDQILGLLGRFTEQWAKYADSVETVRRRFESVQREFDQLATTRRRGLERPLRELDALRAERGVLHEAAPLHLVDPPDPEGRVGPSALPGIVVGDGRGA